MNDDFIDRLAQKVVNEFSDKEIEIFSFQDTLEVCTPSRFVTSTK